MNITQKTAIAKAYLRASRKRFTRKSSARVFLSEKNKVAYLPLPKVANSSIKYSLMPLVRRDPRTVSNIHKFSKRYETAWSRAAEIIDSEWFIFCIVRSPVERLRSAYVEKVVEKECELPEFRQMGLTPGTDFREFVKVVEFWPLCELDQHLLPQTSLLTGAIDDPRIHYFKVENLWSEWGVIADEIFRRSGIHLAAPETVNKSGSKMNKPSVSGSVMRQIHRKYNRDFSFFGYG